jgi:CubicO group peptidase (beta-lactamase class C family)
MVNSMAMKRLTLILILIILLLPYKGNAQVSPESALFRELRTADSLVFEEGFNKCNFEILQLIMHKDLQFLHDQNGTQNRDEFFRVFKESICTNPAGKPIRKLVYGSLIVFPLKNEGKIYGAIQMGVHEFYMAVPGKAPRFTSKGKFIHTWLLVNGQWQLYRVISYDHQQPVKYPAMFEDNFPYPLFDKDSQIENLLEKLKIPSVSIGYIENGKLQQIRAFGDQKPGVTVTTSSIYKVASLTKPITAMVVLKLIEAGKWSLDEPVSDYYVDPDVKGSPFLEKLTTRYILSQQSGFPNWRYLRDDNRLVFDFEPGTEFQYSGEGYEYLRKAIEQKLHKPLEQLADELIFTPLKMSDTQYFWTHDTDESRYAIESDTLGQPMEYEKYTTANAAANLLTTVGDYGRFLVHILNGAGLSPQLYSDFISSHSTMKEGINWGLGMQVFPDLPDGEFALVHTGGDYGTKCVAILLPASKRGLIIFTNSENGLRIWKKIIEEYLGEAGKEIVRRNLE